MARVNQYCVKGYKSIEYTKRSGGDVKGYEISLQAIEPDDNVVGEQMESVFLNCKYSTFQPELGLCVRKVYNQWGKIEDLLEI